MRHLLGKSWPHRPLISSPRNLSGDKGVLDINPIRTGLDGNFPVIYLPLPSKDELCRFTLRPYGYSVGDFIQSIKNEDGGIDRVGIYSNDGVRWAKFTPLEVLLRNSFDIVIDDNRHTVLPLLEKVDKSGGIISVEDRFRMSLVDLFTTFNITEHRESIERKYTDQIAYLTKELEPYERSKREMIKFADRKAQLIGWFGLAFMGVQTGVLARLTWFEYSWDIMEPVTYFVTYVTGMFFYAYFMVTRQEYTYRDARNRHFLQALHKVFAKKKLDVDLYNDFTDKLAVANKNLDALRNNFLQLQILKAEHKL